MRKGLNILNIKNLILTILVTYTAEAVGQNPYYDLFVTSKEKTFCFDNNFGKGVLEWRKNKWEKGNQFLYSDSFARQLLLVTQKNYSVVLESFSLIKSAKIKGLGDLYPVKQVIRYKKYVSGKQSLTLFGHVNFISKLGVKFLVKNIPFAVTCDENLNIKNYFVYANNDPDVNMLRPAYMISSFEALSLDDSTFVFPVQATATFTGKNTFKTLVDYEDGFGVFRLNKYKKVFYLDSIYTGHFSPCRKHVLGGDPVFVFENIYHFSNFLLFKRGSVIYATHDNVPLIQPVDSNDGIFYPTSIYKNKPCYGDSWKLGVDPAPVRRGNTPFEKMPTQCFWIEQNANQIILFIWNSITGKIELIGLNNSFKRVFSKEVLLPLSQVPISYKEGKIFSINRETSILHITDLP